MINWLSVIGTSFWVVGLALILAGLSYYHWLAEQLGHPFWQEIKGRRFQRVAALGLLLVGIGLAITAGNVWQMIPAIALILVCVVALLSLFREWKNRHLG